MNFDYAASFAKELDIKDVLAPFRERFYIPQVKGREAVYFTGNSLGLQPKSVKSFIEQELEDWKNLGVEGHFHAKRPWMHYHKFFTEKLAKLTGAKPHEVVAMNNLTVNLHLLLVSFYRPKGKRAKIMMEAGAFPSDMYAIESQLRHHGLNYDEHVIEIKPKTGSHYIEHEDILQAIEQHKDELALVFFSGVQYYSGQVFNIKAITKAAHQVGAIAGFDLAHAAGNILLNLHDWNVDFAAWCSYKYLNSGPGGVSGVFVHEKHGLNPETPRFAGWWGYKEENRFKMERGYVPEPGAAGWQLSNAPVFSMAPHLASLEVFDEAGIENLNKKSKDLTAYLEFVIKKAVEFNPLVEIEIITPPEPYRGAQLSLLTNDKGKKLFEHLTKMAVIADWREPNVIRIAPVPLYNSFMDVYDFGKALESFKG
jgi:kynureninase